MKAEISTGILIFEDARLLRELCTATGSASFRKSGFLQNSAFEKERSLEFRFELFFAMAVAVGRQTSEGCRLLRSRGKLYFLRPQSEVFEVAEGTEQ